MENRVLSSVGRASPLQGEGRWFEPTSTHHFFDWYVCVITQVPEPGELGKSRRSFNKCCFQVSVSRTQVELEW